MKAGFWSFGRPIQSFWSQTIRSLDGSALGWQMPWAAPRPSWHLYGASDLHRLGRVMFYSAGGTLAVPSPPQQNRKLPAFGKAWAFPRNLSGMKTVSVLQAPSHDPPRHPLSSSTSYRCYICGRGRTLVWGLFGLPPAPRSCARRMWQHRRNRQTIIVKRRRLQP